MKGSVIKAIIFDCFGVLYTSGMRAFLDNMVPAEQRTAARDLLRAYDRGMLSRPELLAKLSELTNVPAQEVDKAIFTGFVLNEAVLKYVDELHVDYRTSMLSNQGKMTFQYIKDALMPRFDDFVLSFDTGILKPDRRVFMLAAERLRVAPGECVFIDDDPHNSEAATACGMKAVTFTDVASLRRELGLLLADADNEAPLGTD